MKNQLFTLSLILMFFAVQELSAQRGYFDAPYLRYEADQAILSNGALATLKSYAQADLQSEASDQICVDMSSADATAEFTFSEAADGLVIRYSVPDGDSAVISVYDESEKIATLTLTSKWSWEYLWKNGDPNNNGIVNENPRMRFDEVRYKLPEKLSTLKLVKESGNLSLDFVEMEIIPNEIPAPEGSALFEGDGSSLQAFIDANGSKTIYIPAGVYNINSQLYFGVAQTKIQGAGMWYSQLNFTVTNESNGGLRANARDISYADLFITTDMTTRTKGYAGIHGIYTTGSTIQNMWVEHCATGAWIGQYVASGPAYADGFVMTGCRFRNTFADGMNLCKGTRNAIVEHCNFRNNGDDGMAIWSADGLECINNTYRHNTVENGWRAAGAALYGGKDNRFYDIIIKDNLEVGITLTNTFPGVGFNEAGMHDFFDITITGCGTFNGTYNERLGAINIYHANSAGTKIQNIRMNNIDINDSKCDGIRIAKSSGAGIDNLVFENVTINTTGVEYPSNNVENSTAERGFAVFFEKFPLGEASYCSLNYSNLGGNANGVAFSTAQQGTFSWTELTGCEITAVTGINLSPPDTSITGGATFELQALFSPANATNKIVNYSSDDASIATVAYDGRVTGLSKGQTTITVSTQDGNFTASSTIHVTSDPLVYYYIKNRWQSTYLYDAGDRVKYKLNASDDTYLWKIEDTDETKKIKNIETGDYMHMEDLLGYVQCTEGFSQSESSKWTLEDAGDGYVRIRSQWNSSDYIHIENLQNQAQYGTIEDPWWSAMWFLEPVLATSVANIKGEKAGSIYPNPSGGEFMLTTDSFESNEKVALSIFATTGQLMYSESYQLSSRDKQSIRVNTGNILQPGSYFVVLIGNSKTVKAKLVISR
jgi:hypothetical protein